MQNKLIKLSGLSMIFPDDIVVKICSYSRGLPRIINTICTHFGQTTSGHFACMPDFGAGCYLADLKDIFWNTEKLTAVLGKVDGITVAYALSSISDQLHNTYQF